MIVTLDASSIRQLASNPTAVQEFPFLKAYAPAPAGCCGAAARGPDPRKAVSSLIGLPPERLAVLKRILGATTIVAYVVRAARQVKVEI